MTKNQFAQFRVYRAPSGVYLSLQHDDQLRGNVRALDFDGTQVVYAVRHIPYEKQRTIKSVFLNKTGIRAPVDFTAFYEQIGACQLVLRLQYWMCPTSAFKWTTRRSRGDKMVIVRFCNIRDQCYIALFTPDSGLSWTVIYTENTVPSVDDGIFSGNPMFLQNVGSSFSEWIDELSSRDGWPVSRHQEDSDFPCSSERVSDVDALKFYGESVLIAPKHRYFADLESIESDAQQSATAKGY